MQYFFIIFTSLLSTIVKLSIYRLLRSIIQYRCNVFVSEARIALEIKTIATNYYRISFLRLFPNLLASLWWFCHLLNLANMKSQLIYTSPFPISDFFIAVVVSRDCTQFVANWRTTFLGHSLWVRFELVLGWSRLGAEAETVA